MCSTGEQKALLIGLVLAQARLIKKVSEGVAPLVLLDEVAAHLDIERRLALFTAIANLDAQVWMTGTDIDIFDPLRGLTSAQFFRVCNGGFARVGDAESHFNS
jgi:DNA replication and repair protein RecF